MPIAHRILVSTRRVPLRMSHDSFERRGHAGERKGLEHVYLAEGIWNISSERLERHVTHGFTTPMTIHKLTNTSKEHMLIKGLGNMQLWQHTWQPNCKVQQRVNYEQDHA